MHQYETYHSQEMKEQAHWLVTLVLPNLVLHHLNVPRGSLLFTFVCSDSIAMVYLCKTCTVSNCAGVAWREVLQGAWQKTDTENEPSAFGLASSVWWHGCLVMEAHLISDLTCVVTSGLEANLKDVVG